jgi:hypothetical protein
MYSLSILASKSATFLAFPKSIINKPETAGFLLNNLESRCGLQEIEIHLLSMQLFDDL